LCPQQCPNLAKALFAHRAYVLTRSAEIENCISIRLYMFSKALSRRIKILVRDKIECGVKKNVNVKFEHGYGTSSTILLLVFPIGM